MHKKRLMGLLFIITAGTLVISLCIYFYLGKNRNRSELEPPMGKMLAPDKFIDHLNGKDQLKYFDSIGQWYSKKDGSDWWIIGESSEKYIKLISKQNLSSDDNGTLKLDCILKESGELGLFYGEYVIIVSSKTIVLGKLNLKEPNLIENKLDDKTVLAMDYSEPVIFSISNGFTLGTEKRVRNISVNGKGFTIPNQTQTADLKFGIFYKGDKSIQVGRFRWFRGGS